MKWCSVKALGLAATFDAAKPSCFEKLKSLIEEVLNMNLVGTIKEKKKIF